MTDPLSTDAVEQRLRAALARRATGDGAVTGTTEDLDAGLDDLGRRIGAWAATETRSAPARPVPSDDGAPAGPSTDSVIPLPAATPRSGPRPRARLAAAACVVAVLAVGAVAATMRDGRSAPLAVSAIDVSVGATDGADPLIVPVTKGAFAGMEAEVSPSSYRVPVGTKEVTITAMLTNPTGATIVGPGCALDGSRYGLIGPGADAGDLTQGSAGSCAVERSRFEPGSRTPIEWTVLLSPAQRAGDETQYRAVIEAGDDALHIEVPVLVERGPRTTETTPTTAAPTPTTTVPADPGGGAEGDPCGLTEYDVRQYVGRTEAFARIGAEDQGRTVRVVEVDGRPLAVRDDRDCNRLNLTLVDGIVTDISLG